MAKRHKRESGKAHGSAATGEPGAAAGAVRPAPDRSAARRLVGEGAQEGGGEERWWLLWAGLAAAAVMVFFVSVRAAAPAPWSYDEYFHFGMARELRLHFPLRSFPWTPYSLVSEHFADGTPLFHLALLPLAGLSIENAGLAGVILGQLFVLVCMGAALRRMRVRHAWAYILGVATLGSMFGMRFDMCRPHLLLIGFSLLFVGLLVSGARPWVLALVTALFGLAHAGGWIAVFYTAAWAVAGLLAVEAPETPQAPDGGGRRLAWRPVVWVALGWFAGQLLNPNVPYNLRLMALVNVVVPFEASPAGNGALRTQIGEELTPPGLAILAEQWTIFLAPLAVAVTLWRRPRLRTRSTLTTALIALAFLVLGSLLLRRMLELGAPLALLALAALAAERRRQGLPGVLGGWTAMAGAGALLVGALWTSATLRSYGFGKVSPPQEMARWLGEHGRRGERVFTAQWGDAAPLFYSAPQLQSLVALDPTLFYAKDPRRFAEYVDLVQGRRPDAARAVRQDFGARWVTLWRMPVYERFAEQLVASPGVRVVYNDANYLIADLQSP